MDKKRLMKMAGYADDLEDVDELELMSKLEAMCSGYGKKKDMSAAKISDLEAAKATAESERDAIKAELEAAKTELEAARAEAAESFVSELVASGKIPPKADKMKASLKKLFLSDPADAREFASELTASNPGSERITDEGHTKDDDKDKPLADRIYAKAQEITASKAIPWSDAVELARTSLK
jgi:outer membrane murein-binding lipoprotein Lpp